MASEQPTIRERSIYSNRTVKYSIKAVTTYVLPWAPQVLSATLAAIAKEFISNSRRLNYFGKVKQ